MRKVLSFGLVFLLCFSGCASQPKSSREITKITGMNVVIAPQFDAAGPFIDGRAWVGEKESGGTMKYYFIDEAGKAVSQKYDFVMNFNEGFAVVGLKDNSLEAPATHRFGYIDREGKEAIPLIYPGNEAWHCLSFYQGYAVTLSLAKSEERAVVGMIDTAGKPLADAEESIPTDWVRKVSTDPRLLDLTYQLDLENDVIGWSTLQKARAGELEFPVTLYNGEQTAWFDEELNCLLKIEGYGIRDEATKRILQILNLRDPDRQSAKLLNFEGQEIAGGFISLALGPQDQLIGSWKDPESGEIVQSLINPQGEAYGEKAIWIMGYSEGYILQKEPRLYVLTDWQFQPVAEVEADSLGVYVKEINQGRPIYQPFLSKETFSSTKQGETTWTQEVLNKQGEAILPPLENSVTWPVEEKWLVRAEGGGTQTPRLVLYDLEGNPMKVLEGAVNFTVDYAGGEVFYRYVIGEENHAFKLEADEQGGLVFIEWEGNEQTPTLSRPDETERILRENQDSSLLGISDGATPVKLTVGGQTLAEAPGLSLIEKNVFKQAQTVDRQRLQAKEMTLRTSDGRWESEVCEAIGLLSENKLAFCQDQKWGYWQGAGE